MGRSVRFDRDLLGFEVLGQRFLSEGAFMIAYRQAGAASCHRPATIVKRSGAANVLPREAT